MPSSSDAVIVGTGDKGNGILRSSTTKAMLTFSSVALLLLSFFDSSSNSTANLKDLSDTVTRLTLQLHDFGHSAHEEREKAIRSELADLEHQLEEKKIELAWAKEHVENQKISQEIMFEAMTQEITEDQHYIEESQKMMTEVGQKTEKLSKDLMAEENENAKLKVALNFALAELAVAREKLPPAPGEKAIDLHNDIVNRRLRSQNTPGYQPGDCVDIIEYQDGLMEPALRPGKKICCSEIFECVVNGPKKISRLSSFIVKLMQESYRMRKTRMEPST